MIRNPSQLTLLDVGGDGVGATVLAALADAFTRQRSRMLQVINPFRPFTETVEGCLRMRDAIEKASKLTVSGLVGNANLIDDTTVDDLVYGYDFIRACADAAGLPVEFITISNVLLPEIDINRFDCPILPMDRQLVPPWKRSEAFGN